MSSMHKSSHRAGKEHGEEEELEIKPFCHLK